eukprot:CAMPEP_0116864410 /NCGR_PEP_ID=MMETSP0418-20121206/24804_1 /TAXON_ID=1158023 /ORGANISM="Astrosyne radiata, Strain 13vi08-1A" /LENGTH=50 /DNA_ID=CAMNT_0004499623 /DNA_START=123 /DNA_END=271 /DNA_ORIENTATION=-
MSSRNSVKGCVLSSCGAVSKLMVMDDTNRHAYWKVKHSPSIPVNFKLTHA